jgi:hypothetical protein
MVQICMITSMAGAAKDRAETIRRIFYKLVENYAYKTPIAWVAPIDVCTEKILPKLEKLNEEFRKLTGKELAVVFTANVDEEFLRQLMRYAEQPRNPKARKIPVST